MIMYTLTTMRNNNNNIIVILLNTFFSFFISVYAIVKQSIVYFFGMVFSIMFAIFEFAKYLSSFFSYSSKLNYKYNSAFFSQVEYFFFPIFFSYYNFFSTYAKRVLYFLSFAIPYFFVLGLELSNESLLLGCIIFTIFLLYGSVKDLLVASILSDVQNIRILFQKKLELLSKIYSLEKSMIEEQAVVIASMEECISKLVAFEQASFDVDSAIFDGLLDQTFSDSLFDYYILEAKDEFYKDYFFIEDNFDEACSRFIDENF